MNELIKHFDYSYYIKKYPDLKHLSQKQAKWHCFGLRGIGDGIREGRIFCYKLEEFNKKEYLLNNKFLSNKSIIEIYTHYFNNYNNNLEILHYFPY